MNAKHMIIVGSFLLAGCRNPGLPPEPPEQDATNPEVLSTDTRAPADPFTRSAFEGVKLDGGGHHDHHGHHGHGKAKSETKAEPAPAQPAAEGQPAPSADHSGHGQGGRS